MKRESLKTPFLIRVARTVELLSENFDLYRKEEIKAFLILAGKMCRQEHRSPGYWKRHHQKLAHR